MKPFSFRRGLVTALALCAGAVPARSAGGDVTVVRDDASGTLVFLPLTHFLTFAPGDGWFDAAPGLGFGAVGGWCAILVYVLLIGAALWLRWKNGAWRRIRL